tara:strand:- start:481 stop:1299 length:819 start_codon:yes stop_codon:yes gene_type:complete
MEKDLLLIGGGKMGAALVQGWLSKGFSKTKISIIEPNEVNSSKLINLGLKVFDSLASFDRSVKQSVVILAVKPQIIESVALELKNVMIDNNVILSIAAGVNLEFLNKCIGRNTAIVRAMPNTPAQISAGITVLCKNNFCSDEDVAITNELMSSVGQTEWVDEEFLFDAVTAISGSGPAYLFYYLECLENAGVNIGLPRDLSKKLSMYTVLGAANLCSLSAKTPLSLREEVTSIGGTTEAGLKVLMGERGLEDIIEKTVKAASERSKEISNLL